jgi:hypothetical protein
MTVKHAMTINKGWVHAGTSGFSPAGFITRLINTIKLQIIVGYQDENGFHTGQKPTKKEIAWPSIW